MSGFLDLMVEVFENQGTHTQAAVGMESLPGNISIEIDMVVEIQGK